MRENWPAISSPLPNADFRLDSEGQFPRGVGSWSETWASRQSSGRLGGWEVLIPIWSLPWHLPLPSPHPNPSLRRVDSAPKSTWNLIMSHHACYPSAHDPAGAPTSLRAKAESSPWPARSAHPTPSLNATPLAYSVAAVQASWLLRGEDSRGPASGPLHLLFRLPGTLFPLLPSNLYLASLPERHHFLLSTPTYWGDHPLWHPDSPSCARVFLPDLYHDSLYHMLVGAGLFPLVEG